MKGPHARLAAIGVSVALSLVLLPVSAAAQGSLTNGENHVGTIASAGEVDTWTFTAAAGDAIWLSVGDHLEPAFVPWIRLRRPDGTEIGSNYGASAAQIAVTAPLSGTYTVLVASADVGHSGTGTYTLTLAKTPGDFVVPAGDEGGPLTNGANHRGHIHVGDLDMWSFTAAKGDAIWLSVGEILTSEIDPGFSPWIVLRGPDGIQLGSNYGAWVAQIGVTAPLTGTYTVIVATADVGHDATGDYQLMLAKTPGAFVVPEGDEGGPLTNGANHRGHIHVGDLDMWSFTAAKGDAIWLSVGEILTSEIDPGFSPWIVLRGPDGAELGSNYGAWVAQIGVTAPLTGTYTVIVATADVGHDGAGDYQLTLAKTPGAFVVPEGDEGGPLTNGANHRGHIHVGDLDQWTFPAAKGDAIWLSIGEVLDSEVDPGFSPWIVLRGPDGTELGSNYGAWVAQIGVTAPLTGTYTVIVATADVGHDATGDYTLTLALTPGAFVVPAGDDGGPMTNGFLHTGTIFKGDLDQWTFTAAAGAALTVAIADVTPGEVDTRFTPWIVLRGPNGAELASNYGSVTAQINRTAPSSGLYTVIVGTANVGRDGTGAYTLRVDGASTPVTYYTVTPVAGPNGTMSPATPQSVAAGATVSFTIAPSAGYTVAGVGGSCAGTLTGLTFTTAAVTGDCTVTVTFTAVSTPPPPPTPSLDRTVVRFAAVTSGGTFLQQTDAQTVRLQGTGAFGWTASVSQPWLTISPSSGAGPVDLRLGVVPMPGVPAVGSVDATVTLSFTGASIDRLEFGASLTTLAAGTTASPFGYVDTPVDFSTGVTGAVPFTGWGLDDVEVDGVVICRAAVVFEGAVSDPRCGRAGQVFVGEAIFIDRARTDVEAAYGAYPLASRAGWGFMVLTNMLPDVARRLPTGGNGTFQFSMYARDKEGHLQLLGTRTLTCDNEHATLPFGAIDTPGQGGVASGSSYVNFGWALTQNPKIIPVDGSTIWVYVDGVTLGNVTYNNYRSDIATFFPGLANSNGAVGFRVLDTTTLTNGLHTIAWGVADSGGAFTGIGSRFFLVANPGAAAGAAASPDAAEASPDIAEASSEEAVRMALPAVTADEQASALARMIAASPIDPHAIAGRRGFDPDAPGRTYAADVDGVIHVFAEELDRLELELGGGDEMTGYLRVGSMFVPLPAGSHLDPATGVFTWTPGAGFVGEYDLVFVRSRAAAAIARQDVRVRLAPKSRARHGAQVVIETPRRQQDVGQPFVLSGWAADGRALDGTGIDTIHVWAYPLDGGPPVFVGVAEQGIDRPDVAAVEGEQFLGAGYRLPIAGLTPGIYNLAVFAWSRVTGGFVPAVTVQVIVRP